VTGTTPSSEPTFQPPVGVPGGSTTPSTPVRPIQSNSTTPNQALGNVPSGGSITVDPIGNRLLFVGTSQQFEQLRQTLAKLDIPPKQVLIEVTIAEVTLTDATNYGLEFMFKHAGVPATSGGTLGGIGLGSSGFNFSYIGSDVTAAFNAFASNNKVNILSRPRIIARSGAEAQIQVGSDVPIITSQQSASATTNGNSNILQSIQYRQTGIILKLKPVVYGDRVDIEISQEVSNQQNNANTAISSPIILNRSLNTKLSVGDGATAVLGGLIDDQYTKGNTGIPILKDIPILGSAFRTDTVSGTKTDLLLLITPYIVRDNDQMSSLANDMTADMNRAFRIGRGFSYTLLPISTGVNLGLTLPKVHPGGRGLVNEKAAETIPATPIDTAPRDGSMQLPAPLSQGPKTSLAAPSAPTPSVQR
jgi:general secretion pathway protein D